MNILMIDTSGPACGVAIMADGRLVYEAELTHRQTHSQRVMPMVDTALQMSDMTAADMDVFGAVVGPGSFTGVRIGVSTVKALAHAANKPCVAVDALEALAANVTAFDGVVCPILDARAQQVYGAIFKRGERLTEDTVEKPQHNGLRAGSACALAARRLEAGETPLDYITLLPLYLRAPQAERERAAREGAKHG